MASLACAATAARSARAAGTPAPDTASDDEGDRTVQAASDPARFLPGGLSAKTGNALAAGTTFGGYDGASHAPQFGVGAQARLGSRVIIGVGASYVGGLDGQERAMRPSVVGSVQLLDQKRHQIDGSVALSYRQDLFFREEGFFQVAALLGHTFEHGSLTASLAYGQDGEGDDHVGDLRVAGLGNIGRALHVGFDGHVYRLLRSTDPNLATLGTTSLQYSVGPAAVYTAGPLALTFETGWSSVSAGGRTESGVLTLGGVGAVF
jgi:hypothetical protein